MHLTELFFLWISVDLTEYSYGYILIIDSQHKGRDYQIIIKYKENKRMPRFDRTGPLGQGQGTGRGLGLCGAGMAYGGGYGRGFGCRRFFTKGEEGDILKEESDLLEQELKAIKERLIELKAQK
jgi:Family of unknown function (DUF5320)